MPKRGESLILNHETAKWIAKKNITAEGFYLRSGRNFSADWVSRTEEQEFVDWANSDGLQRIRFPPYWGEFIHDWRCGKTTVRMPGPTRTLKAIA